MEIKKFFPKFFPRAPVFRAIALLTFLLLVFISYHVLTRSEDPGAIIITPAHFPANSSSESTSHYIWSKVVRTSSGIFPLKSDSYNAMSLSIAPQGFWYKGVLETGWRIPVKVAGFGATRSGYGLLTANGLKTITLRIDKSPDVSTLTSMGLHGDEEYYADMLSAAAGSLGDKTWPAYSAEDVLDSADKPVTYSPDTQTDKTRNRSSTTLNKWQYTDLSGGDHSDAVYAIDTFSICSPGETEEIRFITTFSWGLLDSSQNEIGLRIRLPPGPTTLTKEQLDYYHISVSTGPSGQKFYTIDRVDCEAY